MDRRIHFILGSSAGGTLRRAIPGIDVIETQGDFVEGPYQYGRMDQLDAAKERNWWHGRLAGPSWQESDGLSQALQAVSERGAVIWMADGAAEQLHSCWLAALLEECMCEIPTLVLARPAGREKKHLGAVSPEDFFGRTEYPWPLDDQIRAVDCWNTFVAPTPELFCKQALALSDHQHFSNLHALFGRFPSFEDGLTQWERLIFRRIAAHDERLAVSLGHTLAEGWDTTPDLIGDQILMTYLNEFTVGGLLRREGTGEHIRSSDYYPTEIGIEVLNGRANRISIAGIDRWIGGTHLNDRDAMWWYSEDGEIRIFQRGVKSR